MLSYSRGPDAPMVEKTVGEMFREAARKFAGDEAYVSMHEGLRLSYGELYARCEQTARGLAGMGLRAGDRVGVWAGNCVEWVLLQFGCAMAGVVLVNVNPAYRSVDLGYALRKSGMRALFLRRCDARANYTGILEEALAGGRAALKDIVYFGEDSWTRMLDGGADFVFETRPEEVTNIQYTSGTTGSPKGVLLTHRNLVNNAWALGEWLPMKPGDRLIMTMPLYHCAGCVLSTLNCLIRGAVVVSPSAQFDARASLQCMQTERITLAGGVPTMLVGMLEQPDFESFDLSSVKLVWTGGSPSPVALMEKVLERMRVPRAFILYGQTEASPLITMAHPEDTREQCITTVGRAALNTEVKIVATVTGETVPAGEQGEICTRGYLVMKGYDQEPAATANAIDEEGWLHTGDLGVMDPDEHFHITGRAKEMIIRGGENLFPAEIEAFLATHPKVAEVCVIGLPDAKLGEAVLAWVRPVAGAAVTAEEMRAYCNGKIAHFKIPQYIRIVDSLPLTVSGKIQRFKVKEQEIEERGLQEVARAKMA